MYRLKHADDLIPKQHLQRYIREGFSRTKCQNVHFGTCNQLALDHLLSCWSAAYKTYLLIYVFQALLRIKSIRRNPRQQMYKLVIAYLKSTSLIPVHTMVTRRLLCFLAKYYSNKQNNLFWTNLLAGFYILIQSPVRQAEIALYQLNNTGLVMYNLAVRRGYIRGLPHGESLMLAFAIMLLCHHYYHSKDTFRKSYIFTCMRYLTGESA